MGLNESTTNQRLTTQELLDWEFNLSDQQRAFITRNIENSVLSIVADELAPFEPALARLLMQYVR